MKSLLAGLAFGATSLAAIAQPIDPFNTRPVTVLPSPASERSLSDILNGVGGPPLFPGFTFDTTVADTPLNNGQSTAGMWRSSSPSIGTTIPTLFVEFSGFSEINKFGIWFGTDQSDIFAYDLLLGGATAGSFAAVSIASGSLGVTGFGCGTVVQCTAPAGMLDDDITPTSFGFYFQTGDGPRIYSVDALNPGGEARFLSFQAGETTNWAFAYEDVALGSSDRDYNDMVVKVESIVAVPEPSTWALMIGGLAVLGTMIRRRSGPS